MVNMGGGTLLDPTSSLLLKTEVESLVKDGHITEWYKDALVQMIFRINFKLGYIDITNYNWTEIDEVDALVKTQSIFYKNNPSG